MQSGQAIRKALTLEREKDMELNTLMQALAKDLAEQMRPMVADMVRQELAAVRTAPDVDLTDLVQHLTGTQLEVMGRHVNLADLAAELNESQLTELASEINLADLVSEINLGDLYTEISLTDLAAEISLTDLATEISPDKLAENIDFEDVIREFLQNNSFSIRP